MLIALSATRLGNRSSQILMDVFTQHLVSSRLASAHSAFCYIYDRLPNSNYPLQVESMSDHISQSSSLTLIKLA